MTQNALAYRARRRKGHNLLEVVIASTIFSTVVIGLIAVWIQHSRAASALGARLVAQHVAQEVMEDCVGAGTRNISAIVSRGPQVITTIETNRGEVKNISYQYSVTAPLDPVTLCRAVTVLVRWHDSTGDSQVEYRTLLAPEPP